MTDQRSVRLPPKAQEKLAEALGTDSLSILVRVALEVTLTQDVRERRPAAPSTLAKTQRQHKRMVDAAERLLAAMEHSTEDMMEALDLGTETSPLQDAIEARVAQWERVARRKPVKSKDWRRRRFLYRLIGALDDAGVKRSYHREGPRVLFLRSALRIADKLDNRKATSGSLRLIQDVYRDYRQRGTWPERSPKRWLYEGDR